jgi:hypothetical protein
MCLIMMMSWIFVEESFPSFWLILDILFSIWIIYIFKDFNVIGITGNMGTGKTTLIKMISYNY